MQQSPRGPLFPSLTSAFRLWSVGCLSQRRMRSERCPWRKGRVWVPRTNHQARTPLWARSLLQDKTCHPTRTPLLARNLRLAKSYHLAKTHLPARNVVQARSRSQARTPHHARNPLQPWPSLSARTFLLGQSPLPAKTSLSSRTPLLRSLLPVKTCPLARSPSQLRRQKALGSPQQPPETHLRPPGQPL